MGIRASAKTKSLKLRENKPVVPMRSWFLFLALVSINSATAIGVIYSTHKNRTLVNDLQQQESFRNLLQVEWGQLLLEQSSLISQGRIEEIATRDLGMKIPDLEKVVIVHHD